MAEAASRSRRLSIRSDLPLEYLDALEQKRRALDDSIHKYIASKEREYKQFEKDLKHQAKRVEAHGTAQQQHQTVAAKTTSPQSAVRALSQTDSRAKVYDNTAENDFGKVSDSTRANAGARGEDFPGVFIPEYLTALDSTTLTRTISEPPVSVEQKPSPAIQRTHSDSVASSVSHPPRLLLSHRTSSSGSSVDGKLVSALKSSSETSRNKQKRVSLAVGDAIVAPSDSVPIALSVNSSSSHSRPRTPGRERSSPLDSVETEATIIDETQAPAATDSNTTLRPSASRDYTTSSQEQDWRITTAQPEPDSPTESDNIGDMFDLLDDDDGEGAEDVDGACYRESTNNEIAGRVPSTHMIKSLDGNLQAEEVELGEPPPEDEDDDNDNDTNALIFAEGVASSYQPDSAGFRRPSATMDPVYKGRSYQNAEKHSVGSLSASYSRALSKSSFSSGSLGESFMARNAEKLMALRAQQQQQGEQSTPALPVR